MTQKSKTAIYPGSFNPFTLGHKSIVDRALELFDRVVIAIGHNESKGSSSNIEIRKKHIQDIFADIPEVEVTVYNGLTSDEAVKCGACAIIRGVRSVSDFESERIMADVNRKLCGIDTILLFSLPEFASLSSSMVRELEHFGADTSKFLPQTDN